MNPKIVVVRHIFPTGDSANLPSTVMYIANVVPFSSSWSANKCRVGSIMSNTTLKMARKTCQEAANGFPLSPPAIIHMSVPKKTKSAPKVRRCAICRQNSEAQ